MHESNLMRKQTYVHLCIQPSQKNLGLTWWDKPFADWCMRRSGCWLDNRKSVYNNVNVL